uniref:F-box-like family protein n=1 Tax=Pithovirus LCPAC406 TaxID=2506599 RepID=A0A481ZE79_9VIRU|nr:MAG: F-box-like family protein [Pithovirus LCPAC406]
MDNISSDSLQKIFTYLDVGEISRKCSTNHLFNRVCRSEFLWKNTLSRDYSITEKGNETWRNKAKEVYLESISFWDNVDYIDYCMTQSFNGGDLLENFEKMLIDHAFRERKEFFIIELIFKAPNYHYMYYMEITRRFSKNFVRLFEKVASLSSQKKISIKWILELVDECECENEKCTQDKWKIRSLVHMYLKYDHLFIDDVDSNKWKEELIRQSI